MECSRAIASPPRLGGPSQMGVPSPISTCVYIPVSATPRVNPPGLTPRQRSTGGKTRLLGISKRGNRCLRVQLIHGARAAMAHLIKQATPTGDRGRRLHARAHPDVVIVALAAKLARVAWAVLRHRRSFDRQAAMDARPGTAAGGAPTPLTTSAEVKDGCPRYGAGRATGSPSRPPYRTVSPQPGNSSPRQPRPALASQGPSTTACPSMPAPIRPAP